MGLQVHAGSKTDTQSTAASGGHPAALLAATRGPALRGCVTVCAACFLDQKAAGCCAHALCGLGTRSLVVRNSESYLYHLRTLVLLVLKACGDVGDPLRRIPDLILTFRNDFPSTLFGRLAPRLCLQRVAIFPQRSQRQARGILGIC